MIIFVAIKNMLREAKEIVINLTFFFFLRNVINLTRRVTFIQYSVNDIFLSHNSNFHYLNS